MAKEFIVPGQMITGAGALDLAETTLGRFGTKAMIVTDQVMVDLGNCGKVESALRRQGIPYTVYPDITGEPTDTMIGNGLKKYVDEGCDFLIALGGGSPIDSMKAIGSLVEKGGNIADYMGKVIDVKMPPMIAVPTTAGTGSEATQFTIITDTEKNIKMLLKGKVLMPDLAIIDPPVHDDRPSQDHSGDRSGCALSCSGGIHFQQSADTVRHLCVIRRETDLPVSSKGFPQWTG